MGPSPLCHGLRVSLCARLHQKILNAMTKNNECLSESASTEGSNPEVDECVTRNEILCERPVSESVSKYGTVQMKQFKQILRVREGQMGKESPVRKKSRRKRATPSDLQNGHVTFSPTDALCSAQTCRERMSGEYFSPPCGTLRCHQQGGGVTSTLVKANRYIPRVGEQCLEACHVDHKHTIRESIAQPDSRGRTLIYFCTNRAGNGNVRTSAWARVHTRIILANPVQRYESMCTCAHS